MKALALLLLGLVVASAERKSYEGYQVLQVVPTTEEQLKFLHNLMLTRVELDFWTEPRRLNVPVDIMVGPSHLRELKEKLMEYQLQDKISISNVQDSISPLWDKLDNHPEQQVFNINDFNTFADIVSWLQTQTTACPSGIICELYSIGSSYEGNQIYIFKISKSGTGRTGYWLDATIHAREWITTATILQIINTFVTQSDANAIDLVNRHDWYFLPVMNPDGYLYTWDSDRLWRKNRRPNAGSICIGTDLNRNFDFRWGNEGVSHEPCGETYCGPSGGSEPETQAVQNELNRLGPSLVSMITIHAYGYMWMFPWGNTVNYNGAICERTTDYDELMRVAELTADAVQNTYGTDRWARGTSCEVIYATTGGTDDYSKGVSNIKYAYCPELRGNSFIISADNIPLSYNEVYNGVVAKVNAINAA